MNTVQELGIEFAQWLQGLGNGFGALMDILAVLVKMEFLSIFLLPLLIWFGPYRVFAPLFLLLMIDVMLGDITKVIFAQPRPWWVSDLQPIDAVDSVYSSPGGYASMMTVFWGYLYITLKKRWLVYTGVLFVVLTTIAKTYHAATLPDHALLGVIQGVLVLIMYHWFVRKNTDWIDDMRVSLGIVSGAGVVIFMMGLMALAFELHSNYQIPLSYLEYKMVPSDRFAGGGITMAAGFFMGATVGFMTMKRQQNNYKDMTLGERSKITKVIAASVGLLVLFILMAGIRSALISGGDRVAEGIFNFMCTSIAGFFILYGNHRLFFQKSVEPSL